MEEHTFKKCSPYAADSSYLTAGTKECLDFKRRDSFSFGLVNFVMEKMVWLQGLASEGQCGLSTTKLCMWDASENR